jgi:hypothetical protein
MNHFLIAFSILTLVFGYSNCGKGAFTPANLSPSNSLGNGKNTMSIGVGSCNRINQPCVSVSICKPGTQTCETISNVLLDTGSSGLRLFKQVVNISLELVTAESGHTIAECMPYAGGDTQWGPLKYADVKLGEQVVSNIPIQIIDAGFSTVPTTCTNNDQSPSVGFNGILGVGNFIADCGSRCATTTSNGVYFTCNGSTCTNATVSLAKQVSNPASFLPIDNNGVVVKLPSVSESGAVSITGTLTFGIGTQANNTPGQVKVFPADSYGNFKTVFNGTTHATAFIDSGSNGIFFPSATLPVCTNATGFYCPTTTQNLSATQMGATGSVSEVINFSVINADTALVPSNPNWVFSNLGGKLNSTDFDWGMPFFLGRTIYVGIEGRPSPLGTGPFWAY